VFVSVPSWSGGLLQSVEVHGTKRSGKTYHSRGHPLTMRCGDRSVGVFVVPKDWGVTSVIGFPKFGVMAVGGIASSQRIFLVMWDIGDKIARKFCQTDKQLGRSTVRIDPRGLCTGKFIP